MKVSVRALERLIGRPLPPVPELVAKIGAQLGEVETVTELGPQYAGAVIVTVASCVSHENSDHLHVCLVDDAGVTPGVERTADGLVQVVCGAPNVRAGMRAVWLPPGSTVPETFHSSEPFVLGARPLRGVVSNGMLASPRELALGDNHDGILDVTDDVAAGTLFADAFELNDTIIAIENKMFTHRPDCFGQLGVAREVAGILGYQFTSPDWYMEAPQIPAGNSLELRITNELPELVPRFMAVALGDVTVADSPVWLQTYLVRLGVRPINNVVDITNYVMLVTGQPLHAYDYDKVRALGDGLTVRYPRDGETIALLNGKTITPRNEAIMIAAGDSLIGLAGVMGGSGTEVSAQTTRIILEAATFTMYSIRRTAMAHGLFTDAVTRFTKGQSPLQNDRAAGLAIQLLGQHSGASVASAVSDEHGELAEPPTVQADVAFVNERLGATLGADEMATLLRNVECGVSDGLMVQAPFWRTDIAVAEDVVEEVGRLYGFDHLPLQLPRRNSQPALRDVLLGRKQTIRNHLSRFGATELLTYSFVPADLLRKAGQDPAQAFQVSNALSPDLQYYRLTLMPSLLDKIHANAKAGYDRFAVFELGKSHQLGDVATDGLPAEHESLAFVYAAADKLQLPGAAYYDARNYLLQLGAALGVALEVRPLTKANAPYQADRSGAVHRQDNGAFVGIIGEYLPSVRRALKLPQQTAGFELDVMALQPDASPRYQAVPRFPKIEQDVCLRVPAATTYAQLAALAQAQLRATYGTTARCLVTPVDIYQRADDQAHKHITLRLSVAHYVRTMTTTELSKQVSALASTARAELNAELV